jgi:hypothetical protein
LVILFILLLLLFPEIARDFWLFFSIARLSYGLQHILSSSRWEDTETCKGVCNLIRSQADECGLTSLTRNYAATGDYRA